MEDERKHHECSELAGGTQQNTQFWLYSCSCQFTCRHTAQKSKYFSAEGCLSDPKKVSQVAKSEGFFKLWKILKEMGIPDHLTCLLRNLYAGQEATV